MTSYPVYTGMLTLRVFCVITLIKYFPHQFIYQQYNLYKYVLLNTTCILNILCKKKRWNDHEKIVRQLYYLIRWMWFISYCVTSIEKYFSSVQQYMKTISQWGRKGRIQDFKLWRAEQLCGFWALQIVTSIQLNIKSKLQKIDQRDHTENT
jgi:hypothetical protein